MNRVLIRSTSASSATRRAEVYLERDETDIDFEPPGGGRSAVPLFVDQIDSLESEFRGDNSVEAHDEVEHNDGATCISISEGAVGCLSNATDGSSWLCRRRRVEASRIGEGGVIDIKNSCGDQDECVGGGACHLEEGSIYMPKQLGHCAPVDCRLGLRRFATECGPSHLSHAFSVASFKPPQLKTIELTVNKLEPICVARNLLFAIGVVLAVQGNTESSECDEFVDRVEGRKAPGDMGVSLYGQASERQCVNGRS